MKIKASLLIVITILISCSRETIFVRDAETRTEPIDLSNGKINRQIYLIGDVGAQPYASEAALSLLKRELTNAEDSVTSVVFLGDNIYPKGLHAKDHPLREFDEAAINAQIDILKDFEGESFFIPGNHDWQQGGKDGFEQNRRQEDYIQDVVGKKIYEPSDGCSGPDEIELSRDVTLIIIDTQWWLHKYEKGRGEKDDCDNSTKADFISAFKEALKKNRNKHVIVAGHHPMHSNGKHGGYYTWGDGLFPLLGLNKKFILPLPVLGSIYPFYRSFFGNIQDIPHPVYQDLKRELTSAMEEYDNVIYACGHEHNLQYFYKKNTHYVVSGSGAKLSGLRFNNQLDFGAEHKGFAKVEIYDNGYAMLKFFSADPLLKDKPIIFQKKIYWKNIKGFRKLAESEKKSYKGQFREVIPDTAFAASEFKRIFFGDLNRDLWTLPIKVPVLDIHNVYGGLQPVERGGGQQTVSIKLVGGDGKEYKLRGIKKSAQFLVERELRGTLAQDVVYDGIAGSHPYASVAMPKFMKAAGLYYTNPKLVYIPKDPILGDYLEEFGGMFALLEIHPDDDLSDMENFGNSKKIENYSDAIEELESHQDHVVDVDFTVKNRIMDMLLGDWDRHDDQWRWATFEEDGKTIYRPIPRDRDQVFFKFDGVIMNIANRKWLLRKFQPFKDDVRDIGGLNYNARYFDRYFLNGADRSVWINKAKELQNEITNEVITSAINDLPQESLELTRENLIETLKARRSNLVEFSERYYDYISKGVDVLGTTKEDYFDVIRLEDGKVEVNVYPREKGKKVEEERFYHRVFDRKETKEIRLYGFGNDDEYKINGKAQKSIDILVIAGDKEDKIEDNSKVSGLSKKTKIYEIEGELDIEKSSETKVFVRKEQDAYFYNRKDFIDNKLLPLPSLGYNLNDGFYIGPGFSYTQQGFKKKPFKYRHKLLANYAFGAEGFNIFYTNDYIELFGKVDFGIDLTLNYPLVYQFYGLGNETQPEREDIGNSQVRIQNRVLNSRFSLSSDDLSNRFTGAFQFRSVDVEQAEFTTDEIVGSSEEFLTVSASYKFERSNQELNPNRGFKFLTELSNTQSLNSTESSFFRLKSEMVLYLPINYFRKQTTLALRGGFTSNFGDFNPLVQSNFLSGITEVRGLPRNRFAGKSAIYGNAEFRKSFFKFQNYIVPLDLGFLLHSDIGRVWIDDDQSERWHSSVGGGIFFNILEYFSLVGSYSVSSEDQLILVRTNFYF